MADTVICVLRCCGGYVEKGESMKIIFESTEEEMQARAKLNAAECCDLCKAFGVVCMCKVCAYAQKCETNCNCGCGDYFIAAVTQKGEKAGA